MPELPDVEIFRRTLERYGLGRRIAEVAVGDARILEGVDPAGFASALQGDLLLETRRHGKNLFARRAKGGHLLMHFGMTGDLQPFESTPPAYARVVYRFDSPPHLAYVNVRMLGHIALVADVESYLRERQIGPDALDPALTPEWFAQALGRGRRSIKAALMDQSLIAGLGNIYADEVLFQAGLRPDVPVSALDRPLREKLFRTIREVLATAVRCGAAAERYVEKLPPDYLTPHRGRGGACPKCGVPLATVSIAGRRSYFCPSCQRDPRG